MIGKIFEKNNLKIALDMLYSKKEKIYPSSITKNNSNRENQVILLMIQSKKGQEIMVIFFA